MISAPITANAGFAELRNREPVAGSTYQSIIDEPMYISSGSPIDLTTKRSTAIPAGSNGRVRVAVSDQRKLEESGTPGTFVNFHICTHQPDVNLHSIPASHADIDAGVASIAAQGYNAIRVHGIEYLLMDSTTGEFSFNADYLDRWDYMLYACKKAGIYWCFQPKSPVLYPDCSGGSLWTANTTKPVLKAKLFTQQDARDHWLTGFNLIYNRVNKYTGINMLQDPALLMVSAFNENSAIFVAMAPSIPNWMWNTRDSAQGTAGMLFGEWLADSSKAHGYADLAALNTSWGTAHASFTAAAASQTGNITSSSNTQRELDAILYCRYLDSNMTAWMRTTIAGLGYTGLQVPLQHFPIPHYLGQEQSAGQNDLWSVHQYAMNSTLASHNGTVGTQYAIWDRLFFAMTMFGYDSGKPFYCDEIGWPYWARFRNQYPIAAAYAAMYGVSGFTMFHQGDLFNANYSTSANTRTRVAEGFEGTAPVDQFSMLVSWFARKYVTEETTVAKTLVCNPKFTGLSPRNTSRLNRGLNDFYGPVSRLPGFAKTRFQWSEAASDDTWAVTYLANSLFNWLDDLKTGGFITADNLGYVSANANHGSIVGFDISVPSLPVMQVASHTLVTGDYVCLTLLNGSGTNWPGTSIRTSQYAVTVNDSTHLAINGLNAATWTGTYSGGGTWCESVNVAQSANKEIALSRRQGWATIDTEKIKFVALGLSATKPTHVAGLTINALDDNAALAIISLDGVAIATSEHLLIGLVGEDQNTGTTWDAGRSVMDVVGDYPIQIRDCTANITVTVANAREMHLYRLQRNGARSSRETPASINAVTGAITLNLRTGSTYPSIWFELIRRT